MKKRNKILIAVLLIAGTSTAVMAYGKHNAWNMSGEEKAEFVTDRVSKHLDLDSQQRLLFADLADTVLAIVVETRSNKAEHLSMVKGLLLEPSFDQTRALQLVQEKTQMVNDRAPQVIASLAGFVDSLSSEQKAELEEMIDNHHQRRHGHDKKRGLEK